MKSAVIFHGFPIPITDKSKIYNYFINKQFEILIPDLLSEKFAFNNTGIINKVISTLGKNTPDVIVGISLGGLLAPSLAELYPNSKLILIATGPYYESRIFIYNLLLKLANLDPFSILVFLSKKIPFKLFQMSYFLINYKLKKSNPETTGHIRKSWNYFSKIPMPKLKQILSYTMKANNIDLVRQIKNETLIIGGSDDKIMPYSLSKKLSASIKNNRLVHVRGSHFEVIKKINYKIIDDFVNYGLKNSYQNN